MWNKYVVVTLKTNHRQGEDQPSADLLNRVQISNQTDDDIEQLQSRVFPTSSPDLPQEALVITGKMSNCQCRK